MENFPEGTFKNFVPGSTNSPRTEFFFEFGRFPPVPSLSKGGKINF
jgi:hypothetical protein